MISEGIKVKDTVEPDGGFEAMYFSADSIVDREFVEYVATQLIERHNQFDSSYKTKKTYLDDARTALFEALTASGHLSTVETTGSLEEIHQMMLSVLLNSYDDDLPEFERQRRFQEICEEITIQSVETQVALGELPPETEVATISDIPGSSEASPEQLIDLGYRTKNQKGMVRSSRLQINEDGTYTRISEQVSRSNSDPLQSSLFLGQQGIEGRAVQNPDSSVLGSQMIHYSSGVAGLMRRLDEFSGANIRYGEIVNSSQVEYDDLIIESAEREKQAEFYINELSEYMQILDERLRDGEITATQHHELLSTEVHRILQAICTLRPEYAEECFGVESGAVYEQAADLVISGDIDGASGFVQANQHREETATFCGMGISTEKLAKDQGISPDSLSSLLFLGLEAWPPHIGQCRVPECVSPKPTEVGGCDVCVGGCELLFNKGWSLSKIVDYYKSLKTVSKKITKKTVTIWDFFSTANKKSKNVRR